MIVNYKDLSSKTVVITGASRGIGKAIAKAFLKQNSKVILISRTDIKWLKSFDEANYILIKRDIQDILFFKRWIKDYTKSNKIDILINNVGVLESSSLLNTTEQHWDNIVNINTKATFFLAQLFAKYMIDNNQGNIIFASSFATKLSSFPFALYGASKSMLLSLVKSFAVELAPYNIRVNAFSPGVIKTDMTKKARKEYKHKMLNDISLHRFGSTKEVSNAILFLASDTSSYINGIDLDISGGKFLIQNNDSIYKRILKNDSKFN